MPDSTKAIAPVGGGYRPPFQQGHDPRRDSFHKGDDPRRGKMTPEVHAKTRKGLSFNRTLKEMLIEEGLKGQEDITGEVKMRIQRVVERIYDEAEVGEAWACQLIFDRVEGKVQAAAPDENEGAKVMLVIRGASTDEI